jgi:predicted metal-dependent peptidase
MNPKEKISKARAGLVLDMPFFGSLALRLDIQEDASCPTAATNGRIMFYNPNFIEKLPLEQVKGIICHEVMHCACAHHVRRQGRDAQKWNIAADYVVNQILEDCKISLPPGRLLDPAYKGMNADEIYNRLPDTDTQAADGGEQGSDPGGCGEVRDAVPGGGGGEGKVKMDSHHLLLKLHRQNKNGKWR